MAPRSGCATSIRVLVPMSSPVLPRLRLKPGKLSLVTSSRMGWAPLKRVRHRVATGHGIGHFPGSSSSVLSPSFEFRYRAA